MQNLSISLTHCNMQQMQNIKRANNAQNAGKHDRFLELNHCAFVMSMVCAPTFSLNSMPPNHSSSMSQIQPVPRLDTTDVMLAGWCWSPPGGDGFQALQLRFFMSRLWR